MFFVFFRAQNGKHKMKNMKNFFMFFVFLYFGRGKMENMEYVFTS